MAGQDGNELYSEDVDLNVSSDDLMDELPDLCMMSDDDDSSCGSLPPPNYHSLDECLDAFNLAEYIRGQSNPAKRQRLQGHVRDDMRPLAFVRFNTRLGKPKPVTIRALLDSCLLYTSPSPRDA